MNKKIATGLILALLIAAAGCQSGGAQTSRDAKNNQDGKLADGAGSGKSVTYVSAPLADPNYEAVGCGAKIEAKRLGVHFDHQESKDFSASSEIPELNAAAATQPDALMVTPADPEGLIAPLNAIVARGTPVITTINELNNSSGITAEVAVDNTAAGKEAAIYMAKRAGGKKVSVAALSFQKGGSRAADDELTGFEKQIKTYPNIKYDGPSYVGNDSGASTDAMNGVLARDPKLFGVFTAFGASAQGILASTRQRDVKPVIVAGYAANTPEIVDALKHGEVAAIVDFPFRDAGKQAMDEAVASALDQKVGKRHVFNTRIYEQKDAGSLGQKCPQ